MRSRIFILRLLVSSLALVVSYQAFAATIYHCNKSQKRCIIQLNEGQKGDRVRVIDEGAHMIDTGKIVMMQKSKDGKGLFGVVEFQKNNKERREILRGYPVIVEIEHENSHLIWNSQISGKRR